MKVNFLAVLCLTSCLACVSNNTVFAMSNNVLENSKFNESGSNKSGFDKSVQPNTLEKSKIELIDYSDCLEFKYLIIKSANKGIEFMQTELPNDIQKNINKLYNEYLSCKKFVKSVVVDVMNRKKNDISNLIEKSYELYITEFERILIYIMDELKNGFICEYDIIKEKLKKNQYNGKMISTKKLDVLFETRRDILSVFSIANEKLNNLKNKLLKEKKFERYCDELLKNCDTDFSNIQTLNQLFIGLNTSDEDKEQILKFYNELHYFRFEMKEKIQNIENDKNSLTNVKCFKYLVDDSNINTNAKILTEFIPSKLKYLLDTIEDDRIKKLEILEDIKRISEKKKLNLKK